MPGSVGEIESSIEFDALLPERLGHFHLLRKIGAGGMGEVHEALDEDLGRRVAIKLVHSRLRSAAGRERLLKEAQAMARLAHPNLVVVHEVGRSDELIFIVMEFVDGPSVAEWLDEQTRTLAEILDVFGQAGRGLAAAHAVGLTHRDFKPANVLIGRDGRVRVADFGLALLSEAELEASREDLDEELALFERVTQTGAMLGTPRYMAPEQFDGHAATPASDQYSFCVALWEALHDELPPHTATSGDAQRSDTARSATPAREARSDLPPALRAALERGLAAEPELRHPDMNALLAALQPARARQRQRRQRVFVVCAVLGLAALGLVSAFRPTSQVEPCAGMEARLEGVWDLERRRQVRAALTATGLSYAEDTAVRVEAGIDVYAGRWVDARREACEATQRGEQSDELLDLRMACLDAHLTHLAATVEIFAEADAQVVEKAGLAVANLPKLERCADLELLLGARTRPTDAALDARLVELESRLVHIRALLEAGRYEQGLDSAQELMDDAQALGHAPFVVQSALLLGDLQQRAGTYEQAEATLEGAYADALRLRMSEESAEAAALLLWVVGHKLARHDEGRIWAKHAGPLSEAAARPEARAAYFNHLGAMAYERAAYAEARELWQQALEFFTRAEGPAHPSVATALNNLGNAAFSLAEYDEARSYFERALELRERSLGPLHPDLAASLNALGIVAKHVGDYGGARAYMERALSIEEQGLGTSHPDLAMSLNNLGNLAFAEGDYRAARDFHRRALALKQQTLSAEHPELATSLNNLGNAESELGEFAAAQANFARALSILETSFGPEHPSVAVTLDNLGLVAAMQGEFVQARSLHERALALGEASLGEQHPELAYTLTALGEALLGCEAPERAGVVLERALELRTTHAVEAVELGKTRMALARAVEHSDRERACMLARAARESFDAGGPAAAKQHAQAQAWLSQPGRCSPP